MFLSYHRACVDFKLLLVYDVIMDHLKVYDGEMLEIWGASTDEYGAFVEERSYIVDTSFDLRFHVLLSYRSELTFLCPSCDNEAVPDWFDHARLFEGRSVLRGMRDGVSICACCDFIFPQPLRFKAARHGRPESCHIIFTWSADLMEKLTPYLAAAGMDVLEESIFMSELMDSLIPIKGRLESDRIGGTRR